MYNKVNVILNKFKTRTKIMYLSWQLIKLSQRPKSYFLDYPHCTVLQNGYAICEIDTTVFFAVKEV